MDGEILWRCIFVFHAMHSPLLKSAALEYIVEINIGCPLELSFENGFTTVIIPQKFYLQGAQINRKNVLFTLAFTVSYFLRELANYEKID